MAQEIPEIYSDQEETGTRIAIYLKYAAMQGYISSVVRTPDTDIFFILLYHTHSIDLVIYQIVNVSEIANAKGQKYCSSVLRLYIFTGEDVTSAR